MTPRSDDFGMALSIVQSKDDGQSVEDAIRPRKYYYKLHILQCQLLIVVIDGTRRSSLGELPPLDRRHQRPACNSARSIAQFRRFQQAFDSGFFLRTTHVGDQGFRLAVAPLLDDESGQNGPCQVFGRAPGSV